MRELDIDVSVIYPTSTDTPKVARKIAFAALALAAVPLALRALRA